MLSRTSRWMLGFSALLLSIAYFTPVWRIDLIAPQYPEGLGMLIRVNTITGIKPADLLRQRGEAMGLIRMRRSFDGIIAGS